MLTQVTVDLRVYSLLTVQRAVAGLSDLYIAGLAEHDDTHVRVSLRPRFDPVPESEVIADFLALLTELTLLDKLAGQGKAAPAVPVRAALHEA